MKRWERRQGKESSGDLVLGAKKKIRGLSRKDHQFEVRNLEQSKTETVMGIVNFKTCWREGCAACEILGDGIGATIERASSRLGPDDSHSRQCLDMCWSGCYLYKSLNPRSVPSVMGMPSPHRSSNPPCSLQMRFQSKRLDMKITYEHSQLQLFPLFPTADVLFIDTKPF